MRDGCAPAQRHHGILVVGEADKIPWRVCAHHDAAFAQKEPHFAVSQGFFELSNAWVVQLDTWKHCLRVIQRVSTQERNAG